MRVLLGDISNYKKNKGKFIFNELANSISEFLMNIICELQFKIKMDDDPFSRNEAMEYEIDYIGQVVTSMEGMFSTIASITNFLM